MASHIRLIAFVTLGVVTGVGMAYWLLNGGVSSFEYWRDKADVLLAVLGLTAINFIIEGVLWNCCLRTFGIRLKPLETVLIFLSGYAGLLMPAQLGRMVRSDGIARAGAAPLPNAIKAEAVYLCFCLLSGVALLAGLLVWKLVIWLAPAAVMVVMTLSLLAGGTILSFARHVHLEFPEKYWSRFSTHALAWSTMVGWLIGGFALFLLVCDLPGSVTLWESMVAAPASQLIGAGTGLPGGIGAVEGALGVSLRLSRLAPDQLALAVAAYRIITFWLWIPVGWFALFALKRIQAPAAGQSRE